jgi:hypothetical protein
MKKFTAFGFVGLIFALTFVDGGCLTKAQTTTIAGATGNLLVCITDHLFTDTDPTFEGVAEECAGAAAADVVAVETSLSSTVDPASPAAIKLHAVHHRVAVTH